MKSISKMINSVLSPDNAISKFLLVEADKHSGHHLGLTPPDVKILNADGTLSPPQLHPTQEYLYEYRTELFAKVVTQINSFPLAYADLGDPCHGNKHRDNLITTRDADQIEIAVQCTTPIFALPNLKYYCQMTGTDAHAFDEHSAEVSITRRLQDKHPRHDIELRSHNHININGRTFDIAHHGPGIGRKLWTESNAAASYLRDTMLKDIQHGTRPADVYLRGHVHGYLHVWYELEWAGEIYHSHLIIVPSWCGMNSYTQQVTKSSPFLTNGLVLFKVSAKGELSIHPFKKTIDMRQRKIF